MVQILNKPVVVSGKRVAIKTISLELKAKIILAKYLPILSGSIGGLALSSIFILKNKSFLGFLIFIVWGLSLNFGAKFRDIFIKNAGSLKPSWSSALIVSMASCYLFFICFNTNTYKSWIIYLLAINVAYLGAKYKCDIFKCCQIKNKPNNLNSIFHYISLPKLEMLVTIIIILITITIIISQAFSPTNAYIIFFSHLILRIFSWFQRYPNRKPMSLLRDYTIILPLTLFILFISQSI